MMNWLKLALPKLPVVFLLAAYSMATFGQNQILQFHSFNKTKGLPFNTVLSTVNDEDGYLWIGGHGGLCRYDGETFQMHVYHAEDSTSISNDAVQIVVPSRLEPGHLWVGTENGLNLFNTRTGKSRRYNLNHVDGVLNNNIRDVVEDKYGGVWIGTFGGGICYLHYASSELLSLINFNPESDLPSKRINDLCLDDERLFVAMEHGGLAILEVKKGSVQQRYRQDDQPGGLSHDIVKHVFIDSRNNVWIGTWGGGLNLMVGNEFKVYNAQNSGLVNNVVTSISEDIRGGLWSTSFGGGLFHLTGDPQNLEFVHYTQKDRKFEIPGNVLWSSYCDMNGNIWLGTYNKGLIHLNVMEHQFPRFELLYDHKSSARILCSYEDQDGGNIWFGTQENGIMVLSNGFDRGKAERVEIPAVQRINQVLSEQQVTKLVRSGDDMVIGTDSGVYQADFSTGVLSEIELLTSTNKDRQQNYLYDLEVARDGSIWLSVYDKGIFHWSKDHELQWFTTKDGLSSNNVYDVFLDQRGNVWAGTSQGLDVLLKGKSAFQRKSESGVTKVLEHKDGQGGRIWFGTFVDGVHVLDLESNEETVFSHDDGLISNPVFNLCFDKAGDLWVYSHSGMSRLKLGARDKASWRVTNFTWSDGVVPFSAIHAFQLLSTGSIILGGDYGFNCFNPQLVDVKPFTPSVAFTDVKIFNKSIYKTGLAAKYGSVHISDLKKVDIDRHANVITFNFTALAYSATDQIQYSYQLEGFDQDWSYTSAANKSATYTNLPGGEYTFKVKCTNSSGLWSDQISHILLVVHPPFWETWWFLSSILVLLLALVIWVVKIQQLKAQRRSQAEIAALKQDRLEADLQHKTEELASSTSHLVQKNDVLNELKTELEQLHAVGGDQVKRKVVSLIKKIETNLDDQKAWDQLEQNFNVIHNDFIIRLTEQYPKLTPNDVKICVYMRMNLSSKEIASLLNIATTSLETSRIRIRKKIGLERGTTLGHFILRF